MGDKKSMRALILVGGFGTRLRPLTLSTPKPLVPFCNKPMIIHQVIALKEVGVTDIILAVAYRPELMRDEMEPWAKELGVTFVYSHEKEPMGTAGPLALARDELLKDENPFFVLNSDCTCKFPLKELLDFHTKNKAEATILVTKVDDPTKYGVVVYDEHSGKISRFVEKPQIFVGDKINAGVYCLDKKILNRIPLQKTSIETQVFPHIAADGTMYAMDLLGFWMDIGQPKDYIVGIGKYLNALRGTSRCNELMCHEEAKKHGYTIVGDVMIDSRAKISRGCVIGPNVTIANDCIVEEAARLENCAILSGSRVGPGTLIKTTIIGWKCVIGGWCRLVNNTVLGEDVAIKNEVYLNGVRVLPNKDVNADVEKPEVIM